MSEEQRQNLQKELENHIKNRLRVNPAIELVSPFSLARELRKTSLIEIIKNPISSDDTEEN